VPERGTALFTNCFAYFAEVGSRRVDAAFTQESSFTPGSWELSGTTCHTAPKLVKIVLPQGRAMEMWEYCLTSLPRPPNVLSYCP